MSKRYGPNTTQVENFLQRLTTLSEAERQSVQGEVALARAAFGWTDNDMVQVGATSMYGRDHEEKILKPAGDRLREITKGYGDERYHEFYFAALSALMGLVLCEVMDAPEFAAWYGPFARVIPVESLGEGLAPPITPAPALGFQMLLSRLRSPHKADRGRIVEVHDMLISAVGGPDRHREALDAALSVAQAAPATEFEEYRDTALAEAMREIQVFGGDDLEKRIDQMLWLKSAVVEGMRRDGLRTDSGDSDEVSQAVSKERTRGEAFLEQFRHCCQDGVLAVAFFSELPSEYSSYLYLPFEAFIPIDSILP